MPWLRSGYCCKCGECCVGDPFPDKEHLALMIDAADAAYCETHPLNADSSVLGTPG
jgi:hypothetical protein